MPRVLLRLFLLLVVLAPLPFGSNRPWAWYAYAVGIASLVLAWGVTKWLKPSSISLSLNPIMVILFVLPCAWVLVQVSTAAPPQWLHPIWELAAQHAGDAVTPLMTVSADLSVEALIRLVSYGLTFFLAFQFARNQHNAQEILRWIAVCGTAYAAFGLMVYWGWVESVFWRDVWSPGDVTSTFRNRNNFATFAGLTLICLVTLLVRGNQPGPGPMPLEMMGRQARIERFITRSWQPVIGMMIVLTALFLSHSRGGFISASLGALVFTLLLARRQRGLSEPQTIVAVAVSALLVFSWSISGSGLVGRFDDISLESEGRADVYQLLVEVIAREPWLGHGYGTFAQSFRLYQDATIDGYYDLAHNTYLENAFELGIPAALSLVLAIAFAAAICLRGSFTRHRDWMFPMAGLSAAVLVGVHALFDFSLQIPAVAITFATILGVGTAQSYRLSEVTKSEES